MRRSILALAFYAALHAAPSFAQKQELTIDLGSDAATLDPHVQWDTDSYSVYRNIFDNLLTRDPSGKIVPQVASAWHYTDDKTLVFDLRTDIRFQDGTKLTPEDVVFSVSRIVNPSFKSPQLSQFDQIVAAEVTGPSQLTLHTKRRTLRCSPSSSSSPSCRSTMWRRSATRSSTYTPSAAAPTN